MISLMHECPKLLKSTQDLNLFGTEEEGSQLTYVQSRISALKLVWKAYNMAETRLKTASKSY